MDPTGVSQVSNLQFEVLRQLLALVELDPAFEKMLRLLLFLTHLEDILQGSWFCCRSSSRFLCHRLLGFLRRRLLLLLCVLTLKVLLLSLGQVHFLRLLMRTNLTSIQFTNIYDDCALDSSFGSSTGIPSSFL